MTCYLNIHLEQLNLVHFPSFLQLKGTSLNSKRRCTAGHIIETIKEIGGQLLEKVELFDIYKGDQIPEGCKSIAFSLTFRDMKKTLTDTEVKITCMKKIKSRLAKKFKGRFKGIKRYLYII